MRTRKPQTRAAARPGKRSATNCGKGSEASKVESEAIHTSSSSSVSNVENKENVAPEVPAAEPSDELSCAICTDIYKDPKLLHCMHTFCGGCIDELVKHEGDKQTVMCPVCRFVTKDKMWRGVVYRCVWTRPLRRFCHVDAPTTQPTQHTPATETSSIIPPTQLDPLYGYYIDDEGNRKVDKENEGLAHIGHPHLPTPLKVSLEAFYSRLPRKETVRDGLKLNRYLANRGRPTQATFARMRYKQQMRMAREKAEKEMEEIRKKEMEKIRKFHFEGSDEEEYDDDDEDEELYDDNLDIGGSRRARRDEKRAEHAARRKMYSMIRYGERETAAYVAARPAAVYASTLKSLNEIKRRDQNYVPKTLLDFGSGTGMSVWAAHTLWGKEITEYQCVEPSEHMTRAAEFLLHGNEFMNTKPIIQNVYFKRFLPFSNELRYDIVVAAYTLSEMPFPRQRVQALRSLWEKTEDFLVIIEPGNTEGFEITLQARNFILRTQNASEEVDSGEEIFTGSCRKALEEGHVFAPCTHEHVCARNDPIKRDHPCNFTQQADLSWTQRSTKMKARNIWRERYSYIIFRKGKNDAIPGGLNGGAWARILKPMVKKHKHLICEVCCKNGNIETHVLTKKKDPYLYKAARKVLTWGDRMPLDELKRPMDVRRPPLPCENNTNSAPEDDD